MTIRPIVAADSYLREQFKIKRTLHRVPVQRQPVKEEGKGDKVDIYV